MVSVAIADGGRARGFGRVGALTAAGGEHPGRQESGGKDQNRFWSSGTWLRSL
jgi:hypothetical protein